MISVIMPSFNQAKFIERSIDSVFAQDINEIELIISDGGSTDGTLDVLRRKSKQYPGLRWTSERDDGPASALNKSLAQCRGTYIGWLNSDDCYLPNVFGQILDHFAKNPDHIMLYGQGQYTDTADKVTSLYPTQRPSVGLDAFRAGCFICQPTVFFRRTLYVMQGPLDETFGASFDYEYWLRAFSNFPGRIGFIETPIAQSRLHAGGITARFRQKVAFEGATLCARYFGYSPLHWLVTYIEEMEVAEGVLFREIDPERQSDIFTRFQPLCDPTELSDLRQNVCS